MMKVMKKFKSTILVIFLIIFASSVYAQKGIKNPYFKLCPIGDYGGCCKSEIVHVLINDNTPNEQIIIETDSTNRLCIDGAYLREIRVLNNDHFLELIFRIRVSNVAVENYALICIANGKLIKAMEINYSSIGDGLDWHCFDTSNIAMKSNPPNYSLVQIRYSKWSGYGPKLDHETMDTVEFRFDPENGVFYNRIDSINGEYSLCNSLGREITKKRFNEEKVHVLNNGYGNNLYYINNFWYYFDDEKRTLTPSDTCVE
jgi:hypothetical protein